MTKVLLTIIAILFIYQLISAQQINANSFKTIPQDTSMWNRFKKVEISENSEHIEALAFELLKELNSTRDAKGTLNMLNSLSMWLLEKRELAKGNELIDSCFKLYRNKYDTLNIDFAFLHSNKAYYYHAFNKFKQQAAHQQTQMDIITKIDSTHPLLVELYTTKASGYFATNQILKGLATADTALYLAKIQNLPYYTTLMYMNIANKLKFYEPYLALDFMNFSAHYAEKYQKEYFKNDPYFYINTGSCFVACDMFKEALKEFKKGLSILKRQENPAINFETAFYYYIGVCHKNTQNFEEASVYYDSAANIFSELFDKRHQAYLRNISMTAQTLIQAGLYEKALPILKETYPLNIEVFGFDNTYYTAQEGENLAKCLLQTGQYEEALEQYAKNISYFYGDSIVRNPYMLPKTDTTGKGEDRTSLMLSYLGKAQTLEKLFATNQSDSLLKNIIAHYQACADISDITANKGHIDDNDVQVITYHMRKLTNSALDFAVENQLSNKSLQDIYKIISKSKAYSLLSTLHKGGKIYHGDHPELYNKEEMLLNIEGALTNQMLNQNSKDYEMLTEQKLDLKKDIFVYKQKNPLKIESISINKVANIDYLIINDNISPGEIIVDIYATKNNLITFEIGINRFQLHSTPLPYDFYANVQELQKAIKTGEQTDDIGRSIFDKLFSKLNLENSNYETITFIPDGALFTIPFEILEDKNGKMIVENFATQYRYTSHLYKNKSEPIKTNTFLAIAPVFQHNNNKIALKEQFRDTNIDSIGIFRQGKYELAALPYSADETTELTNRFKANNWQSTLLLNEDANEHNFKIQSKNKSIIHIATHGYVDNSNPEKSGLFLSQNAFDPIEDNYLYMSEIFNSRINADLVVLSSCKSGYGKLWQGEGILALPRAFLAGGTKNVISSLWKINDEKTKELMLQFYQALEQENNYAKALKKAKLKMIKDKELPIDWSGFTLICN